MKKLIESLMFEFSVDSPESLLKEYCTSNKSEKSLRLLVESSSKYLTEIVDEHYTQEMFTSDLRKGFLSICNLPAYSNRYYVTMLGLSSYLSHLGIDWGEELIRSIESKRLPDFQINFKKEERLFIFMLLILGATNRDKSLKVPDIQTKNKLFEFLQKVDEHGLIRSSFNDQKISWGQGKKISWSKFITEWVDLPKTGLYFKHSKQGVDEFYLDLSNANNIKKFRSFLFNVEGVSIADQLVLYDYVRNMSNKLILELKLGYVVPPVSDDVINRLFN